MDKYESLAAMYAWQQYQKALAAEESTLRSGGNEPSAFDSIPGPRNVQELEFLLDRFEAAMSVYRSKSRT